jgi:putative peptidoglycan lipid II flippase
LIFIGRPLISLLERGAFDASASALVYSTLQFFALGLIVHSALEVVARSFYADKDTLTPLWAALGGAAINLILSFQLSQVNDAEGFYLSNAVIGQFPTMGFTGRIGNVSGLALANSLGVIFEVGFLLIILRRRWHGIREDALARTVAKTTVASLIMAAAIIAIDLAWRALGLDSRRLTFTVAQLGVQTAAGGVTFLVAAYLLKMEELNLLLNMIRRRVDPDALAVIAPKESE